MKQRFLDFVADVMEADSSEISLETEYNQYEKWDSLMMLNLIMELEVEYGISIPMEKVGEIKTLNDFWKMVSEDGPNG